MPMNKDELMNAFRNAACAELADCSPNEADHSYEFSKEFERRMDRLIRSESKSNLTIGKYKPKKAAYNFCRD